MCLQIYFCWEETPKLKEVNAEVVKDRSEPKINAIVLGQYVDVSFVTYWMACRESQT